MNVNIQENELFDEKNRFVRDFLESTGNTFIQIKHIASTAD